MHGRDRRALLRTDVVRTSTVFRTVVGIPSVSRQQCKTQTQTCERHRCEVTSANAHSAKETTLKSPRCERGKSAKVKCAKVKCAKVRKANATSVRSDNTEMIQTARSRRFCLQDGIGLKKKKTLSQSLSFSLSVKGFIFCFFQV